MVSQENRRNLRKQARIDQDYERLRNEHQKELAEMKKQLAVKEYERSLEEAEMKEEEEAEMVECYSKDTQIPKEVSSMTITIDRKREAVIFPIYNIPTVAHLSRIRSVSKSDESDVSFIRINFNVTNPLKTPDGLHMLSSLTFKSTNQPRIANLVKEIAEAKKQYNLAEEKKKEQKNLIKQASLVLFKMRAAYLSNVSIRPSLEGKKYPGDLEIHSNGLLYRQAIGLNSKLEILFTNIKHLILIPSDNDPLIILHFHLKDPILINKKKTKDVQFYKETEKATTEETAGARRKIYHREEEEIQLERMETERIERENNEFIIFGEKVSKASGALDLQIPNKDHSFLGITERQTNTLQITDETLIQVTEPPFCIVTLSDVEVVSLERIVFGLKNFDMVFVFYDKKRTPISISSIPMQSLEHVKEWLDSSNVHFIEGKTNYNWGTMLKMVRNDPLEFYGQGGWQTLQPDAEEDNPSSGESVFDDSEAEKEESEDDEEYDESEVDESDEDDYEEDEGLDWDELEEKTKREEEESEKRW
eukprot:GHVP01036193.1.p1 GENE.GHVP01036193.1~~GHVP01036193.1.p1  ORF type:complete len:533 (-),score=158.23 GHVP01036193.1:380-1978(-)